MQIICIKRKQIRQKSYIARNLETFFVFFTKLECDSKARSGSLKTTRPPNVEPYMRLRYVQSHHRVQQAKPKHPVLIDVAKLP